MLNQAKAKVAQDEAQFAYDEAEYRRNLGLIATRAVSHSDLDKTAAARNIDIANVAADKAVVASRQLDLEFYEDHGADQRARQPLPRHGGQPDPVGGPGQRHPAHDHRVGGPDVRLLRRGRAHRAARPAVDPRRQGQVGRDVACRVAGPGQRGGVSAPGHDQFRGQPGQSENRHACASGACSRTRTRRSRPAFSPASACPSARPTRRCWSPTAPSTTIRARRSSTSSTTRTRWSPAPFGPGALHDGLRAIEDGLKPGERVIVNGLQTVRSGITVEPKLVDMPRSNPKSEDRNPKQVQVSRSQ